MHPLKDLNRSPEGRQTANQCLKYRYATSAAERKAKNLRDKAWRRRTGKVPYTHTKSEAEMIADYINKRAK